MRDWRVLFYFHRQVKEIFFFTANLNKAFHLRLFTKELDKRALQVILVQCTNNKYARAYKQS